MLRAMRGSRLARRRSSSRRAEAPATPDAAGSAWSAATVGLGPGSATGGSAGANRQPAPEAPLVLLGQAGMG